MSGSFSDVSILEDMKVKVMFAYLHRNVRMLSSLKQNSDVIESVAFIDTNLM